MRNLLIFSIILIVTLACGDYSKNTNKLSQKDIDKYTGYAIVDAIAQIYNINLAGKPTGGVNLEANCPMGGGVKITGNVGFSQNNGITTVDLTFVMTDCKSNKHTENNIDTSFTFTGTIVWKGSFDSSREYNATNYQAEQLKMQGTIDLTNYEKTVVDQTCKIYVTVTNTTVSGTICNREFSY